MSAPTRRRWRSMSFVNERIALEGALGKARLAYSQRFSRRISADQG